MRVLVVDDKESIRDMLNTALVEQGHHVETASDVPSALKAARNSSFDLILTDMRMPGASGLDLIREMRQVDIDVGIVVMTAFGTVENAVEAMKAGASDYLPKPFSIDHLAMVLNRVGRRMRLEDENRSFRRASDPGKKSLVGTSPKIRELRQLISKVAQSDVSVLILGESGVGKEVVAHEIHRAGPRANGPFLSVHCAALASGVLESELFGHERGAFTGATRRHLGRFELASGGTLLLDEIGDLPPDVQVKLLHVLQEKEIQRVGGSHPISVNTRILAATHRNLEAEVRAGRFREDLYFRLRVVPLWVPPLRELNDDLSLLASYFLKRLRPGFSLSTSALDSLKAYPWPGNIRELEHAMERAVTLSSGPELTEKDFSLGSGDILSPESGGSSRGSADVVPLREAIEELEKSLIKNAMSASGGNRSRAARMLKIPRTALIYKIRKYGI